MASKKQVDDPALSSNQFGTQIDGYSNLDKGKQAALLALLRKNGVNIVTPGDPMNPGPAQLQDPAQVANVVYDRSGSGGSPVNRAEQFGSVQSEYDKLLARRQAEGRMINYGFTETGSHQSMDADKELVRLKAIIDAQKSIMPKDKASSAPATPTRGSTHDTPSHETVPTRGQANDTTSHGGMDNASKARMIMSMAPQMKPFISEEDKKRKGINLGSLMPRNFGDY